MKNEELKKIYEYNEKEKLFTISIHLEEYRDVYSNWDFSPYNNRDLDDDLIEYMLECSYEIPIKYNFIIEFHLLNQKYNKEREDKSILGMKNYFSYQLRKLKGQRIRMLKEMTSFLLIGTALLSSAFYLSSLGSSSFFISIITEGFFIGGWVMLWEMFSSWFFDIKKLDLKISHFKRLKESPIKYLYGSDDTSFD